MLRKSSRDTLKHFNGIFLKRITPPTCSRLYGIEPVGIGTPLVESLTSYIVRLASAHCVWVSTLVAKVIAPLIDKDYLTDKSSTSLSSQFSISAKAINGFGITATDWVDAMQNLTLKRNLHFLTMLRWKDLITKSRLLRKVRAWCPNCYEEWHQHEKPIYDPLIWAINAVTVCPIHSCFLKDRCGHCNKQLPSLHLRARPSICPYCNHWLGVGPGSRQSEDEGLTDEQLKRQLWVFDNLGMMLGAISSLPSLHEKQVIADIVSLCIKQLTRGDIKSFVRRFPSFNYDVIDNWQKGVQLPELSRLMELCYHAEVSIKNMLIGVATLDDFSARLAPIRSKDTYYLSGSELNRMEEVLHLMIEEDPPPSINEASVRLGCHYLTFKQHFPDLFLKIQERYLLFQSTRFNKIRVASSLSFAKNEIPPPSLNSIAKLLGCSCGFLRLHFPADARIIANRYIEFRKIFVDPEVARTKFQALQKKSPPLTIKQCAEQLDCSTISLYRYFPEICLAIRTRYFQYRNATTKQKKEKRREAILETSAALEAEGIPTTTYQIRKQLPHIKKLTNREIEAVLND